MNRRPDSWEDPPEDPPEEAPEDADTNWGPPTHAPYGPTDADLNKDCDYWERLE